MNAKLSVLGVAVLVGLLAALGPICAQTWTQATAPGMTWESVASAADGRRVVAVASFGQVHISTNSGAFWFADTNAPYTSYMVSAASSADGSKLAATAYDWVHNFGSVYVSTNSGTTWTNSSPLGVSVAMSADGGKLVLAGVSPFVGPGSILVSTNWGETWTATSAPTTNWSCVAVSADGTKLFAGASKRGGPFWSAVPGPIYRSLDSGASWMVSGIPVAMWTSIASSADGTKLVAAGWGTVFTSSDSGATWFWSYPPAVDLVSVASSADGSKLVAAGASGIFASANSGLSWWPTSAPATNWTSVACSADGNNLVAVVSGGGIYFSQITPSPRLDMTRSDTHAVLSWVVPSLDFVLQENSDLTTTHWTDATTAPTLNFTNLQNELVITSAAGSRFYRLKH